MFDEFHPHEGNDGPSVTLLYILTGCLAFVVLVTGVAAYYLLDYIP